MSEKPSISDHPKTTYIVRTKYDDGYKSERTFDNLDSARVVFMNVDRTMIEHCTLSEIRENVIATKYKK